MVSGEIGGETFAAEAPSDMDSLHLTISPLTLTIARHPATLTVSESSCKLTVELGGGCPLGAALGGHDGNVRVPWPLGPGHCHRMSNGVSETLVSAGAGPEPSAVP